MALNDPEILWYVKKSHNKTAHLLRSHVFKAFQKFFFFLTFTTAIL